MAQSSVIAPKKIGKCEFTGETFFETWIRECASIQQPASPKPASPKPAKALTTSPINIFEYSEHGLLIMDTEAFTIGVGRVRGGNCSLSVYTEVALVLAIPSKNRIKVLYHEALRYDVSAPAIAHYPRAIETIRFTTQLTGQPVIGEGKDPTVSLAEVRSILMQYPDLPLCSKGPALEQRFLAGLAGKEVVIKHHDLPSVVDLGDYGCPKFDALPVRLRIEASSAVPKKHLKEIHPDATRSIHCAAVECVSFAMWANLNMCAPV